jgi:hypothetical protein
MRGNGNGNGCRDCVVTVLRPPSVPDHLGEAELRALGVLADAGMVPPLRFELAGLPALPRRASHVFPETKAS